MKARVTCSVFLLFVCSLASVVFAREAEYGFVTQINVRVPMREGVELATDLYFSARAGSAMAGKFPVILTRTPYNKNGNAILPLLCGARLRFYRAGHARTLCFRWSVALADRRWP